MQAYRPARSVVQTDLANPEKSRDRGGFLNLFLLFWMLGVIFFDKHFAYIRVGPIYITELVLSSLIIFNFRRIRKEDVILGSAFIFYLVGGVLQKRDLFFAVKDMAWMYYLLFLRFFPRNFPEKYIDIVLYASWSRVLIIFCYPIMGQGLGDILAHKYRDSAVVFFLVAYYSLRNPSGRLNLLMLGLLTFVSYLTGYKTLLICLLLLPLIFWLRGRVSRLHSPYRLAIATMLIIWASYYGASAKILELSIDFLNSVVSTFGSESQYSTGTALWRAEIWRSALNRIDGYVGFLFGDFPGLNFMDDKYLGIKLALMGGDRLGVVRSAHNILVQIFMKSGFLGFVIFGWYYFRTVKSDLVVLNIFRLLTLVLAMTADILEVPSRGPLFYCFFAIIEIKFSSDTRNSDLKLTSPDKSARHSSQDRPNAVFQHPTVNWWNAKNAG